MTTETTSTPKTSNIVSLEKVKNACFGAKTDLPGLCPDSAHDFSEIERQFDCTDKLLKISEEQAKQEIKHAKLNALLVKQQLSKGDNLHMITAFMRLHDDVPMDKQRSAIAVMIRQYSPGKPANAKDLGTLVASRVQDVSARFGRDDVFSLLVNLGLIVPNLVSLTLGDNARRGLPWVCLTGAGIVVACDIHSRTLRPPAEIPVGTILGVIGAAVFIILILRQDRHAR